MENESTLNVNQDEEFNQGTENETNENFGETQILTAKKKQKYLSNGGFASLLSIFGIAFLISFFIFQIVLVPIKVVGVSMYPTINASVLSNEDELHCDYVYFSKPYNLTNDDIVIIKNNGYIDDDNDEEFFIKRVVGCPKQTLIFLVVDNLPTLKTYSCVVKDENGNVIQVEESFLDDGKMRLYDPINSSHLFYYSVFPFYQNFYNNLSVYGSYTITLGENEYFIMGDNREQSTDSRFFGPVKNQDIIGKVQLQVKFGETLIQSIFARIKNLI